MFGFPGVLMLLGAATTTLAQTPFYGPEAPCFQWMTNGNFLIANCPGPSITSMTVLDLNHTSFHGVHQSPVFELEMLSDQMSCYASRQGHLFPADYGNFNTKGNCTFVPIDNRETTMHTSCPNAAAGQPNITSDTLLKHIENRDSMLWCGGIKGCYINGPGCLSCQDTWIKDGIHCK